MNEIGGMSVGEIQNWFDLAVEHYKDRRPT